jgi:hypothetical protein
MLHTHNRVAFLLSVFLQNLHLESAMMLLVLVRLSKAGPGACKTCRYIRH